jgi:hypothetical protein
MKLQINNKYWFLLILFFLTAIFVAVRNYYMPELTIRLTEFPIKAYNNYIIFKESFWHLFNSKPLYQTYHPDYYDVFKYTPTFAMFFALFAALPDLVGLILWNLLNALLPLFAFSQIIVVNQNKKWFILIYLLLELVTSLMNSQSNGLILGLMIYAISAFQRENIIRTVTFILLTVFIKLFGIVLFVMFLLKPHLIKKAISYSLFIGTLLFLLPLFIVNWDYLINQYKMMFLLLKKDSLNFVKFSVNGWIYNWFGYLPNKTGLLIIGIIIQLVPLYFIRLRKLTVEVVLKYAASWIIWTVIFNHMAESATFVIAIGGISLYLLSLKDWYWYHYILMVFTIAFTELGPTDVYPVSIRIWIVETAQLKVFPCILFWILITTENIIGEFKQNKNGDTLSIAT